MLLDAGLVISWGQLAERALKAEEYVKKYKDDPNTAQDGIFMYQSYINIMLLGIDNTPIFDFASSEFSKDAKADYVDFINKNPDSVTANILTEYITYLASINYKIDFNNEQQSKVYFDTCKWLVSEAGKRVVK